jgi:hypothetical protein
MRTAGFLVFLCLAAVLFGCKNKSDADAAPDPAALKAQQELLARRDKLLASRVQLQGDREKLKVEIGEIEAKGGDASEQKKKLVDLDTQIESQTSEVISVLGSKIDALGGDKAAQVAGREAGIGSREKMVAEREARIAEREKLLAQREVESAQRWKDSCNTGGGAVIIQQAAPKGGNYGKKDVSDLIAKAKAGMAKKGLLNSDLGPAAGLEGEAGKALNENDMSKAYFAAAQLAGTVDSIQINRLFIKGKYERLSAQVKNSKVDDATNQQLASILTDVMQNYNNGDFTAANKRLNALATMLAKQP